MEGSFYRFSRSFRSLLAGAALLLPDCLGLTPLQVEGLEELLASSEPADRICAIQAASESG